MRDGMIDSYNGHAHQFVVGSHLAVWNIAHEQAPHEAEVLRTELIAIVKIEDVLLAYAAFNGRWHFHRRDRLSHAAAYTHHR